MFAIFNHLEIEMTMEQAQRMSHSGQCIKDVQAEIENGLAKQLEGKEDAIRKELYEYGAWDETELANNDDNKERILWIAAGDIIEEYWSE